MKITITKKELIRILKLSETIINKNRIYMSNPMMTYVFFSISKKESSLWCTNGITSGKFIIKQDEIEVNESGNICLIPKNIIDLISKLNENKITLHKTDNNGLIIKTNNYNAQINLIDEHEYPQLNFELNVNNKIEFKINEIEAIQEKVAWAVLPSTDSIKPLNGIYVSTDLQNGSISCLGTDSYKLAYLNLPSNQKLDHSFILDTTLLRILSEINKISNNQKYEFALDINNRAKLCITSDGMTIIDKLIIGEYPYQVFDKAFKINENTKITVSKRDMVNAIERGKIFIYSSKNPLVSLEINQDGVSFKYASYEFGTSIENIKPISFEGHPLKINFNSNYLGAVLNAVKEENLILTLENDLKPMIVTSSDPNFKELVLPLKTH